MPICSYCKKIRDDQNYWQQVESYVGKHSDAKFSHSICPQCYEEIVKPQMVQLGVDPNETVPSQSSDANLSWARLYKFVTSTKRFR